jgi:hypothetical protein
MSADIKKRTEQALDAYKESAAINGGNIEKNKFNVKVIQYPSDLQSAPNLQHYVLFNINVRGKSKFNIDNRQFEVKRDPNSANLSKDQLGSDTIRLATEGAAVVATGVAVTSLVSKAGEAFGKTGATKAASKVLGVGAGVVAGTAAGLAVGATMAAADILKKDTTYRISDAIALYVDGPPSVKYSMNYANKELGTLLGILSGSVFDSQGLVGAGAETVSAMGSALAKLPGAFGAADVSSALSVSSGTSLNPFKETVFESVDFRSFAFKYKFFPKNKKESDDVYDIIRTFKFHMHPEMSEGKLFFIYPSEFNIAYYFGSEENGYFHKFATCVLESMDVNYGGEQFSSFRDGSPTEINMSLTFRELEILTKNMVKEGY